MRLDPETGELEWLGRRGDPIKVQELGIFSLVSDPDPPVLILEGVDGLHDEDRPTISGTVQDVGSGVSSAAVTATFSGQPGHVTLDSTGRITVTPAQSLSSGTHELQVMVTDRAGNIARSTHGLTIAAPFDVIEAIAVPNPTRGPLARIRYHLTRPASTVRIRFYDSAGRRLQSLDGSSFTGKNDLFWDLTTSRGYQVGPGIVLFRLDASDGSGKTVQHRGKIAIMR